MPERMIDVLVSPALAIPGRREQIETWGRTWSEQWAREMAGMVLDIAQGVAAGSHDVGALWEWEASYMQPFDDHFKDTPMADLVHGAALLSWEHGDGYRTERSVRDAVKWHLEQALAGKRTMETVWEYQGVDIVEEAQEVVDGPIVPLRLPDWQLSTTPMLEAVS